MSQEQLESVISPTGDQLATSARAAFHRQPDQQLFDRLLVTVRAASPQHVEGAMRSQHAFDVTGQLAGLSLPVLVIGGDRDRHIPIRHTLLTAADIHRCAVQIYHNVGHAPFFEVPDEFAALLEGFALEDLQKQQTSPDSGSAIGTGKIICGRGQLTIGSRSAEVR